MSKKILLGVSAFALAIAVSGHAGAQGRSIGGVPVPDDQAGAVEARCTELTTTPQSASANPGSNTQATSAPASGASDDPKTMESEAEEPVEPAGGAPQEGGNMAADRAPDNAVPVEQPRTPRFDQPPAQTGTPQGQVGNMQPGPSAEAPAAGANDDPAAMESEAEAPVVPATAESQQAGGNMAADTPSNTPANAGGQTQATVAGSRINIADLTPELCREGGF